MATSTTRVPPRSPRSPRPPRPPVAELEADIIAALAEGDRHRALTLMFKRYGDLIYRHLLSVVGCTAAADDIRQRVFIDAFEDLAGFEGRSSLRTWLLGIARHRYLDENKKDRRWNERFKNDADPDICARDAAGADAELERQRDAEQLRRCIRKLSMPVREAVTLRHIDDLSFDEIAQVMGDTPGTLQQRVSRALPALRRCLMARLQAAAGVHRRRANHERRLASGSGSTPAMTCDRFWHVGVRLAERGDPDPHRDECARCQLDHESYLDFLQTLRLVNRDAQGKPGWELRVQRGIAAEARRRRAPWLIGSLAAMCAALALVMIVPRDDAGRRPGFEIESDATAMRSTPTRSTATRAHIGDRLRVFAGHGDEVRVYRAGRLVQRCFANVATFGCVPDDDGLVAHITLAEGDYDILVVPATTTPPSGTLDRDRAELLKRDEKHELFDLSVR